MLKPLTTREIVKRLVIAANLGESPGAFRINLALREAERIAAELREAEAEETCRHYAHEMTGEES